jgi:cell division protein ZapA
LKGFKLIGGTPVGQKKQTRITVDICHKPYTIIGKESASHIELVASLVDQKMRDIQSASGHLDTSMLAVLTAVNTMNDYLKLKEDYATLLGSQRKKEDK